MKRVLVIKALASAFAVSIVFSALSFEANCRQISGEVFRLHILANSDSYEDQALKLEVRDRVLNYTEKMFEAAEDKADAMTVTEQNIAEIIKIADDTVREKGYDYTVDAQVLNMPFDTREYENFIMPAGNYDALRITIGEGNGKNWWCVMFPPMCVSAATDKTENVFDKTQLDIIENKDKYEYKFKVVEIYESIVNHFKAEEETAASEPSTETKTEPSTEPKTEQSGYTKENKVSESTEPTGNTKGSTKAKADLNQPFTTEASEKPYVKNTTQPTKSR